MTIRTVLPVLALLLGAAVASGQDTSHARTQPSHRLFVRSDLYVVGAFGAATLAMFPLDRRIEQSVRAERWRDDRKLGDISRALAYLGGPGPFVIGASAWLVGRAARLPALAEIALHGTESVVVGVGVASALKLTFGRARPFVSNDSNPASWALGRGFKGDRYQSFPSAHTTASFSAAAALSAELSERWPRKKWLFAPVLYGGSTLVGLARMYSDQHWASDVVLGAAIGIFAGQKTVRFNHTRTGNRMDRIFLGPNAVGVRLTF